MMPTPDDRPQMRCPVIPTDAHAGVCSGPQSLRFFAGEAGRIFSIGGSFPSRTVSTTIDRLADSALSPLSNALKFQS